MVRIPKQHEAGFRNLLQLSEIHFDALLEALSRIVPSEDVPITPHVEQATGMNGKDSTQAFQAIKSLYKFKHYSGLTTKSLATAILDAMDRNADFYGALLTESREESLRRLNQLLAINALDVRAKADVVRNDHSKVFIDSKVLTDIRPVFHEDPTQQLIGAVVVHNLKIEFLENGRRCSHHYALDIFDVENLIEVLNRATAKEVKLLDTLNSAKLTHIVQDVEQEEE